jgi:hypothetical protein
MKLPKLREGPWRIVFEGMVQEHEVNIFSNTESVLMVLILEKEKDKVSGAVIELFKVLVSKGALEEFIETLPKDAISLISHSKDETIKYLVLGSTSSYSVIEENAFADEVDKLLQKIHSSSETVKNVAKAYDLNLLELHKSGEETSNAFFSNPIMFFGLSTSNKSGAIHESHTSVKIIKGDVILGLTKDKLAAREPLSLFEKSAVFDGKKAERKHILHLIIEGALLSNIPAVIFDFNNSFEGLNVPSKNITGLQQSKVDFEPIGFPVKNFTPLQDVKIDLDLVSAQTLIELFGIGEGNAAKILTDLMKRESYQDIPQMIKKLNQSGFDEAITKSDIYKAGRILKLIDVSYPNFFDSKNNIAEVSKNWVKAIGRAGVINMDSLDNRQALLLLNNLLKGILEHYKKQGETSSVKTMIFISEAERFFGLGLKNIASEEIVNTLNELKDFGIGYVFEAKSANKLNPNASKNLESQIYVIEKNEVGLKLANRKQYRVRTRPGLSECMEDLSETIAKKKE